MSDWTALDWIIVIGVVATVVGAILAYLQLRSSTKTPSQTSGHGGVNVGGDNAGDINTVNQTRREK